MKSNRFIKRLDWYIIKKFLGTYVFAIALIISIAVVFDFNEKMDKLMGCQLAKMGCPIKGDLKYGSPRSNPDGSICLHARRVRFIHPVSKELIELEAPLPEGNLWKGFAID